MGTVLAHERRVGPSWGAPTVLPMTEAAGQPLQLRIAFRAPQRPISLSLALSGLYVLVESPDGSYDEVWQYLTAAGITPVADSVRGVSFACRELPALANLPPQVRSSADEILAPLFLLATHPSAAGLPATLAVDAYGDLQLSWFDGEHNFDQRFLTPAAAALLQSDLAFVATSEAWDILKSCSQLPVLVARAKLNLDGYVELATGKPQLLESAPPERIRGLFRLDETHFGLPLAYAEDVDTNPGFVWEGHRPVPDQGPDLLPPTRISLSAHHQADLRTLVDQLAAYRAQAVVWDSGLGRRVFTLAAIDSLDAWPLLIVTPPSGVWIWQRHLDLLGKTYSLTHDRADVQIITYLDLARRPALSAPQAIIFDELAGEEASSPAGRNALHRLDGVLDAYRIAVESSWPAESGAAVRLMSVLRPGEFRDDVQLAQRYPVHTERRAAEHVSVYLSTRRLAETTQPGEDYRRSSVMTVHASETLVKALGTARARHASPATATHGPAALLAETLEIVTAGPDQGIGPKVAQAARRALDAAAMGRRVAVVTRHRRAANLVRGACRPTHVVLFEAGTGDPAAALNDARLAVVRYDATLPDLRSFDEVVVLDYPWSFETLERAVGSAADESGPSQVTVVHMTGTVDDRLAMLAARRRELGALIDATGPPSAKEVDYLLAPRSAATPE